jgi:murein DD-endopeptidase MepM/ murein hydrolase activator NlpD
MSVTGTAAKFYAADHVDFSYDLLILYTCDSPYSNFPPCLSSASKKIITVPLWDIFMSGIIDQRKSGYLNSLHIVTGILKSNIFLQNLVSMIQHEKTTILFVNKGPRVLKPIHVSSKLLLNWKKYLVVLILFVCLLVGTIVYLVINSFKQYQLQLALTKKLSATHKLLSGVDTNAVRKKLDTINKELSLINGSLEARGIQTTLKLSKDNTTGEARPVSFDNNTNRFENFLRQVAYNVSYTPLGLPYNGAITSRFGVRENPFGTEETETHKGIDIRGPMGGQVKATAMGTVEFAGQKNGFGNCIIVKHGNGFKTLYGHLSKILVTAGQKIDIGQKIGLIGSTGRSTGPHLHYEIVHYGAKVDPSSFLTLN